VLVGAASADVAGVGEVLFLGCFAVFEQAERGFVGGADEVRACFVVGGVSDGEDEVGEGEGADEDGRVCGRRSFLRSFR
jgi:hypothetical protein